MKPIINFFLIFGAVMVTILLFWPDVINRVVYPILKFLGMVD